MHQKAVRPINKMNNPLSKTKNMESKLKKKDFKPKTIWYKGPHRPTANILFFTNLKNKKNDSLTQSSLNLKEGLNTSVKETIKKKTNQKEHNKPIDPLLIAGVIGGEEHSSFLIKQSKLDSISTNLFPKKVKKKIVHFEIVQSDNLLKQKKLSLFKKLRNTLMSQGKQSVADKILKECCLFIKLREKKKPLDFIYESIHNVKPLVELEKKSKKNFSKKKSKAIPIASQRAFKLAVE